MATPLISVLVVDDFEPFRRCVAAILQQRPELRIIAEASDGLEAVRKAVDLQPDLILLDIGLPKLNGIEAARQIREFSSRSKLIFLSANRSWDIAQAALRTGAGGYVVKSDAARELLPAVEAVLRGEQFVSASLAGNDLTNIRNERTTNRADREEIAAPLSPQNVWIARRHKAAFYSNDRNFLDHLTLFVGAALSAGNAAIVVATESHRDMLLPRLQILGLDIGAAIEQGRYIALDAADALPTFMLNDMPDPVRFSKLFGKVISTAAKAVKREHARVALFGEMCHLLWAQGNPEGAIQVEKLGNQLAQTFDVDILCGYSLGGLQGGMDSRVFERICAEHSAISSR